MMTLEKKTYEAPTLKVYGTVAEFTRGQNTCDCDNANGGRQNNGQVGTPGCYTGTCPRPAPGGAP